MPAKKRAALDDFIAPKEAARPASAPGEKSRHIQVRLDVDRYMRLREFALHDGRPLQRIITDLIDGLLDPKNPKRRR